MSDELRALDGRLATLAQSAASLPKTTESPSLSPPPVTVSATPEREAPSGADELPPPAPRLTGRRGRAPRLVKPRAEAAVVHTPQQRLLLLDTWQRSGLPAGDFAALVGVSKHTLYAWKKRFDAAGPGRADGPAARRDRTAAGCRS